jgi:sugar phosphate isomerase/epimerase
MYVLSGFTDEAGDTIEEQIRAVRKLGWNHLELRSIEGKNAHDISEEDFDRVRKVLDKAEVGVSCFGSNIANWGTPIETPFEQTLETLNRVIKRAKKLPTRYVRIMSYAVRVDENGLVLDDQKVAERIERLRIIAGELLENELTPVHENCFNYGGMSWRHSLELAEKIPGLKFAYDTGNPALQYDYSASGSLKKQSPWEFYSNIKPHIAYVHIKDAGLDEDRGEEQYYFPGDGESEVVPVVRDLLNNGYEGTFSIEPHMAVVYHDASVTSEKEVRFSNFVEYGRRFMKLLEETGAPNKMEP